MGISAAAIQRMVVFGAELRVQLGPTLTYADGKSAQGGEVDVEYRLDGHPVLMLTLSDRPGRDQHLGLRNVLGERGWCTIGCIAPSVPESASAVAKLVQEVQELARLKRSVVELSGQSQVGNFGVITDGLYRYTPTMDIERSGRIVTVSIVGNQTVDLRNVDGVMKVGLSDVGQLHDPHRLREVLKDLTKSDW